MTPRIHPAQSFDFQQQISLAEQAAISADYTD